MDGHRHAVTSADGTEIGLLTAGDGPPLLLVHGGMGCIESWQPLWEPLTSRWRVTAMDRRGRGSSGDNQPYRLSREFEDVTAVAASLEGRVDVFGHSYGAVCALGAAAQGAPVRRLALYEPPGPQAAPAQWRERMLPMIAAGQPGRAMMSFLTEIIGLSAEEVEPLRDAPRGYDVMPIVSATMPRESEGPGHRRPVRPGRQGRGPRAAHPRVGQPGVGAGHHPGSWPRCYRGRPWPRWTARVMTRSTRRRAAAG